MRSSRHLLIVVWLTAPLLAGCAGDAGVADADSALPDETVAENAQAAANQQDDAKRTADALLASNDRSSDKDSPDDEVKRPDNPLVRGIQTLLDSSLGASEFSKEHDSLEKTLLEADAEITRVKNENREAMRQANRQVRLRGPQSPNIVLILADDLGYGDLSCYGQKRIRTPHIDQMAKEGIRFTDFYAGSPESRISRLCLMTGLHTGYATKADTESMGLHSKHSTMAEVLWQAGYSTGVVGLWDMPPNNSATSPNIHGFDEWLGFRSVEEAQNPYPEYLWSNQGQVKVVANADGEKKQYANEFFTSEALSFMKRHRRDRPFFLCIWYPLPGTNRAVPHTAGESVKNWTQPQRNRAASVATLDHNVSRILDQLRSLGLDRNTAVFLTSDNTPDADEAEFFNSNGPFRGHKGDLSEGGLRVPLVVRWPYRVRKGQVSNHPCASWDLLPTFGKMVGAIWRPRRQHAISLFGTLANRKQKVHTFLAWNGGHSDYSRVARIGDWKVFRSAESGVYEIYNVKDDPGETKNVAAEHPEVIKEFETWFPTSDAIVVN